MSESFGMMEGAYFVGRIELLTWLNSFFGFSYTKVEECASAAAYCQILDAIYPGKVQLHKVKFDTKLEYEWIQNFKVLQRGFDQVGLKKYIDIQKLTKGKYQDNLEFLQWFKRYFDMEYNPSSNYDAVARRRQARQLAKSKSKASAAAKRMPRASIAVSRNVEKVSPHGAPDFASQTPAVVADSRRKPRKQPLAASGANKPPMRKADLNVATVEAKYQKRVADVQAKLDNALSQLREKEAEVAHVRAVGQGLEQERDYYFRKLQQIEQMIQREYQDESEEPTDPLAARVLNILYVDETDETTGSS